MKTTYRNICAFLLHLAWFFIGCALTFISNIPETIAPVVVEEQIDIRDKEAVEPYDVAMAMYAQYQNFINTCPVICYTEPVDLENYSCLMYATKPIGRYYVTAYNHEETGSKITASGKTCHEGTITTCAADVPKYLKFGDVIEVDGRLYVVEDTGSAVKKRHVDLYFKSYKAMSKYGSNYQNIYKVEFPFGRPQYE